MSTVIGMDIDAARNLVRMMQSDADQITSLSGTLTNQLHDTPWVGNDATAFKSDWDGQYKPALDRITEALRENATSLSNQADDQERASS